MEPSQEIDLIDYAEGEASLWETFSSIKYEPEALLNLLVIVAMFIVAKFIFRSFIMTGKRGMEIKSNNMAYSISTFSLFISLALIVSSVVYGDVVTSTGDAVSKIFTYTSLGIILLMFSGLIFDKIALSQFNLNKAISEGNESAAIVDAGNFFASALIISSILMWEEFKTIDSVISILSIYFVSQIMLTIATLVRGVIFNNPKRGVKLQEQIEKNNRAVAIDFAGRRIATAFAITAATNLLSYRDEYDLSQIIIEWVAVSLVLILGLNILAWISSKIIFFKRSVYEDILEKNNNSAIGDAAIYISFGIILSQTLY